MKQTTQRPPIPFFTLEEILNDTTPMPDDLIAPQVLPPGGLVIINRTFEIDTDKFILDCLFHMAAGVPFQGLKPLRPLNIFYVETQLQYHYLRERIQNLDLPESVLTRGDDNILLTPRLKFSLNDVGVERMIENIKKIKQQKTKLDILMISPIDNVFDSGPNYHGKDANDAMLFFIEQRVTKIRDAINPDAGIILVKYIEKITKQTFEDELSITPRGISYLKNLYLSNNKLIDKL